MCLFLILFIVGSVLAGNGMSARAAGDFLPRMAKLQEGSSVFDICVLKSDVSIYMSQDKGSKAQSGSEDGHCPEQLL